MSRPSPRRAAALLAPLLLLPAPAGAQGDLLSDRVVMTLVEEVLIADLMLRSCEGVEGSDEGAAEVQRIADELARRSGHSPETAAALLSRPDALSRIEADARRRLLMMGARPEDAGALCAVARRVAGGPGVLGALIRTAPHPE